MLPLSRPPRLRARPLRGIRGALAATLRVGVGMGMAVALSLAAVPPIWAADGKPPAKSRGTRAAAGTAATAAATAAANGAAAPTNARRAAQVEAGNIAELRSRMTSRDLALLRRADMGDARIAVWLYPPSRQYYVSVSMQGTLRRTLKPVNEAEAWLNFDSFRRLAALGEVGRPVLLGQMNAAGPGPGSGSGHGGDALANSGNAHAGVGTAGMGSSASAAMGSVGIGGSPGSGAAASPGAATALRSGGQDLRTVPVPRERLAAADDVDEMDLERVRRAREAYVSATGGAGGMSGVASAGVAGVAGASGVSGASGAGRVSTGLPPMPSASPVAPSRPAAEAPSIASAIEASSVVGQAVETLRRERIGDEVARLVWSADSGQFTASLTRQGRVVDMLRSPDRQLAVAAFDDLVRQAQARAVASAAR